MIKRLLILILIGFAPAFSMEKPKNTISSRLIYTDHAVKRMEERKVTREEIEHVLQTGYRSWEEEDRGAERFTERKNKINPLIVVLDRKLDPNVIITVFKSDPIVKHETRKFTSGRLKEEAYLKQKTAKKEKDLRRITDKP